MINSGVDYTYVIVATTILCGVIVILRFHLKRLHMYKLSAKFKGPPCLPFVGNALLFRGNPSDLMTKFGQLMNAYPISPRRLWLGPELVVPCSDPEEIKKVLCDARLVEKSKPLDYLRASTGNGLITAPAEVWRVHRKLIGPIFHLKILESLVKTFNVHSKALVKKMEKELNGGEFEILPYVSDCAIDVICETAMAASMEELGDSDRRFAEIVQRTGAIAYARVLKPWLHWDITFYRSALGKEFEGLTKFLHGFTDKAIARRREIISRKVFQNTENELGNDMCNLQFEEECFLDHYIKFPLKNNKFSESDIGDELLTVTIAGYETTSFTMSNALYLMANFPDVQEKVHRELIEIYGADDHDEREVKYEDLPRMVYMERVIKETLRLFPPVPFNSRLVTEDIEMDGYTLPKGCIWAVFTFDLHRSAKYWENPLEFNPDRFAPDEVAKRHSHCWIPFSTGPRNCLGIRYAMMEMKTVLATLLRKYIVRNDKFVPISEIDVRADIFLKTTIPVKLRIETRQSQVSCS